MNGRRVVVTGMGMVSSIGKNSDEVLRTLRETRSGVQLDTVLSNSFGFGGTNACVVLSRMRA